MSWYSNKFTHVPPEGFFQYEFSFGRNFGSVWMIYTKDGNQIGYSEYKLSGLPVVVEQELTSQGIWTARTDDGRFFEGLPRGKKYIDIKEK